MNKQKTLWITEIVRLGVALFVEIAILFGFFTFGSLTILFKGFNEFGAMFLYGAIACAVFDVIVIIKTIKSIIGLIKLIKLGYKNKWTVIDADFLTGVNKRANFFGIALVYAIVVFFAAFFVILMDGALHGAISESSIAYAMAVYSKKVFNFPVILMIILGLGNKIYAGVLKKQILATVAAEEK